MSKQRLILVTNDDGYSAPGMRALIQVAKEYGKIIVVAPDKPQSGTGHAITISSTIHLKPIEVEGEEGFACSGTPVDCVKLAVNKILKEKPDLIVSGINHGSNSSVNVIYSGTMSAAVEGALENIPAIGFSLCDHSIDADFSAACFYARKIISQVLSNGLPEKSCLNVNIPKVSKDLIEGIKVCRQADANWEEEFDERTDPQGRIYYWLTGKFVNYDQGKDTDEWALANNFVSVVPTKYDLTNHDHIERLNFLENENG